MSLRQPMQDICIDAYDSVMLHRIGRNNLAKFSEFVFQIYAHHYFKKYNWQPNPQELVEMHAKDQKHFGQSVYFGYKNQAEEFLGTIKATIKANGLSFPIEYEFGVNIQDIIRNKGLQVNEIWHLGRLAIDSNKIRTQKLPITSKQILRLLLINSLSVINRKPNSLMIAESDTHIYDVFHSLGINMQKVGACQECIGSPTYPVIVTGEDINAWLEQCVNDQVDVDKILRLEEPSLV